MKQSNFRYFRHPSAFILIVFALLVLASCQQQSVREQEQIANLETILAGTPSATPTFTPTPTYTPTVTPSPTVGPTSTPSPTLSPTVTPFPPTPTTNPALQGFSFCNQEAGSVGSGRFSASLGEINVRGFPAFERITMDFSLAQGSAPLSANANCLSERDFTIATNEPLAPSPYILQVNLPNWLQDDAFRETLITETLTFTETRMVESMDLRFDLDDDAGATFVIGLKEPVPYRLTLSDDPLQIQIEVARSSPLVASSDQLTIPAGTGMVQVSEPLFFLLDGDVWQISSGQTTRVGTTNRMPTVAPSATAEDTPTVTPDEAEEEATSPASDDADDETPTAASDEEGEVTATPAADQVDDEEGTETVTPASGEADDETLTATPDEVADEAATPIADEADDETLTQTPTSTTVEDEDTPAAATEVPTERTVTPAATDQTDDNAVNLTNSPEEETALAVSPDGTRLAFCRATPGASLSETAFAVSSTLWTMNVDGTGLRQIPFSGISCGDLAFSPDGQRLAFSVNESVVPPDQRSIWIAAVDDGRAQQVAADKEWSRATPQWIGDEALLYNASAQDGRSTLFLLSLADEQERDVGAEILVNERYTALGRPLAAPNGRSVAIEAIRADEDGADLLLLDANGVEQDVIDEGYWARPLAWDEDSTLYYMTTACASTLVQDYTLYRRAAGRDQVIAAGQSLGAIGDGTALVDSIAYVASSRAQPGARGQNAIAPQSSSTVWFWDLVDGGRGELYNAERGIAALTR